MPEDEPIRFLATFPPIQSAIKVDGNGDGMRIQLDIPESEMGQAVMLLAMRETILEITVKSYGKEKENPTGPSSPTEGATGNTNPTPRRKSKP